MKINYNKAINKKTKRQDLVILFGILALAIIANFVIFSFSYFSQNKTAAGTITLGEVDFSITENNAGSITVLPNTVVNKTVSVGNFRNLDSGNYKGLAPIVIRFSVLSFLNGQQNDNLLNYIQVLSNDMFIKHGGYYYFCGVLKAGQKINLCNSLSFNKVIDNMYQQKPLQLHFLVEAVQWQNDAYKEVWPDYPPQLEQYVG